jgi:hypothetical protein
MPCHLSIGTKIMTFRSLIMKLRFFKEAIVGLSTSGFMQHAARMGNTQHAVPLPLQVAPVQMATCIVGGGYMAHPREIGYWPPVPLY